MNKKIIIDGYKGIMDLDLSLVPEKFIKITIDQHLEDIKEYIKYQSQLEPHLRYENTIMRTEIIHKMDKYAQKQRTKLFLEKQAKDDQLRGEIYYRNNKK